MKLVDPILAGVATAFEAVLGLSNVSLRGGGPSSGRVTFWPGSGGGAAEREAVVVGSAGLGAVVLGMDGAELALLVVDAVTGLGDGGSEGVEGAEAVRVGAVGGAVRDGIGAGAVRDGAGVLLTRYGPEGGFGADGTERVGLGADGADAAAGTGVGAGVTVTDAVLGMRE